MYSVEFSYTAEKQLLSLEKNLQERIINVLERILVRPYHFVKKKEGTPYFILRVGDYRVILDIVNDKLKIFVLEIGHRGKIYK